MSKKLLSLFSAVIVAAFVITGCGQSDTTNKEQKKMQPKKTKQKKRIQQKKINLKKKIRRQEN